MAQVEHALPHRVGSHFVVERLLGAGGIARVLQVIDQRSGRRLALKQCRPTAAVSSESRLFALFRQEYRILSQIVHPNVVAVHEYGFDGDQPYYTMECVEGKAVYDLGPLDWQRTCAIMLDLCLPLSLLHARRYVHCDLTPRNVLITEQGTTKLIDFGALAPMDQPPATIAGTPPHMPPELVNRGPLDGRVDIFGLGAFGYWLLSGRHAYPAETIRQLPSVWEVAPQTLTELGVVLPRALDELIMSMLSLDAAARPRQIAEVLQRLCALTGATRSIERSAIGAQLSTSKLVGRDRLVGVFRELLASASEHRSSFLCLQGAKGSGRSRLIDALALEASLAECLVLRVVGNQEREVELEVLSRLMQAAVRQVPAVVSVLPAAIAAASNAETEQSLIEALTQHDPQRALGDLFTALCHNQTVVLLVDNLQHVDLSSLRCLLGLVPAMPRARLLLVGTVTDPVAGTERDVSALLATSHVLRLDPLSVHETQELLGSIFGDAHHLDELAVWAHHASAGVPAVCVELARYLVERGIVSYAAGQFQIPADLSGTEVPQSLEDAIDQRIASLGARPRELLGGFALVTAFAPLTVSEHLELMQIAGCPEPEALTAIDELIDAQFLVLRDAGYELRSDPIRQRIRGWLDPQEARAWNARLGEFYERRGHARRLLSALHYRLADDLAKAYALVLPVDAQLLGPNDPNIPVGGSARGIEMHEALLAHAIAIGAPQPEVFHLRRVLVMIGAGSNPALGAHGEPLLAQLRFDTGLDLWESMDPELGEHARLLACLNKASERYLVLPEQTRGLTVPDAIRQLAACGSAIGTIHAARLDVPRLRTTTSLVARLRTLAPALSIVIDSLEATTLRVASGVRAPGEWRKLVADLAVRPEGMDEQLWQFRLGFMHYRLGMDLADAGDPECLSSVGLLMQQKRLVAHGHSVRLLFALSRGDYHEAQRMRRERAIAVLASGHEDQQLALGSVFELELLDVCGDLLELQRMAAWFEARAKRFAGWAPLATIARVYYLMNCDEPMRAIELLDEALPLAPPLEHAAWYELRALRAEASLQIGDSVTAIALAENVIEQAKRADADMWPNTRAERTLAQAYAQRGDRARALELMEPLLMKVEENPAPTVRAAQIFEARARVALLCGDRQDFNDYVERLEPIYRGAQPGLASKLERLKSAARARLPRSTIGSRHTSELGARDTSHLDRMQTGLEHLSLQEQADYLLFVLLTEFEASGGHLYTIGRDTKPVPVAARSVLRANAALTHRVEEFLRGLERLDDAVTEVETDSDVSAASTIQFIETPGERYRPIPLRDHAGTMRGIALLQGSALVDRCAVPAVLAAVATSLTRL